MQKMGWFGVVVGAAATKSPPPVIYCEVGVSQLHVTESTPPVIYFKAQSVT